MYKLFQSKQNIPWNTLDKVVVPDMDISDDFFNFQEVPTNNINFKQWNIASIIVDTKDITYFKLVKEGGKTTYWYVNKVLRVLKQGFELEIKLDIWMTHTRHVIKRMIELDMKPIINRAYLNKDMLYNDYDLRQIIYYSFYKDDDYISNIDLQYKENKVVPKLIYPITSRDTDNVQPAKFPIETSAAGTTLSFNVNKTLTNEIFGLGYYIVMYNHQLDVFDCFPVTSTIPVSTSNGYNLDNSLSRLLEYVVKRKIQDGDKRYDANSFQGYYRGPIIMSSYSNNGNPNYAAAHGTTGTGKTVFIHTSIVSRATQCYSPIRDIQINNSLLETYIEYSQPIIWANKPLYLRKYFSITDNEISTNKSLTWKLEFNVAFLRGFVLTPRIFTPIMGETEMISFGEQLPSSTPEYYNTIKQIQTTFDTGIVNSIVGGIQGVPSAIGKAGANPLWGVTSLGNSLFTLGRDIYNIKQQRKQSLWSAGGSYLNTSNLNHFHNEQWSSIIEKSQKITTLEYENGSVYFKTGYYISELTDLSKDRIRFIINNYGYVVENSLPIKKWWLYVTPNIANAALQFDDLWLINNINTIYSKLDLQEQEEVINQLSSGIRINRTWG